MAGQAQEFRGVPWGGRESDIIKEEGKPDHSENTAGLKVLVYQNEEITFLNQRGARVTVVYILVEE